MTSAQRLSDGEHDALARRLYEAIRSGEGIGQPSDTIDYVFEDAYQIRRKLVDLLIADGAIPRGHKIGFTSVVMQEMYGMSGPDFGLLLDYMFVDGQTPIEISNLSDTRVEPEIAFEMAESIAGPGATVSDVLAKTARVWPAIEIIDSRVGAMKANAVDSIADNAGAGKILLGPNSFDPAEFSLDQIEIQMTVDGETLSGVSGDVMGHPAEAIAWLANKLTELDGQGGTIKAGDIIMSGGCTRSVAVQAGSTLNATFGPMGVINAEFA